MFEGYGVGAVAQRLGWIGMGFHEQTRHAHGNGRAGQHRHKLALSTAGGSHAAGQLTLWVASNTTGAWVSRMMARLRMSDTRLL